MNNNDASLPEGWKFWPKQSDAASDTTEPRWKRELDQITGTAPVKSRSMPLKVLAPLLMDAYEQDRTWLNDFADDVIVINADLHDVLMAYGKLKPQKNSGDQRSAA